MSAQTDTAPVALYRKYRPESFETIKDQDHIVSVLQGAIEKQTIPHALLFCGGRGTGKTTTARIFAQAVGAAAVDIYEIDAASNRGVDDIRELREAVHTLPYESPVKVYIIDEVHMLTKEAFNALLKTLEEPPAHVIFILATTERDKLLDTITSRCQVFTFRSPSRSVLRDTVLEVAKSEGFDMSTDAADLIAVAADGSYRDALGVTQKVLTASGDTVADADEVATLIGAPRSAHLLAVIEGLHMKDSATALKALASATADHVDMSLFAQLILERLRIVILLRNDVSQVEQLKEQCSESEFERYQAMATDTTSPINSHVLVRFLTAAEQVRHTSLKQLPLELAVIDVTNT